MYEHIDKIIESYRNAALAIKPSGVIVSVNKTLTDISEYSPLELLGGNINILIPEPFKSKHDEFLKNSLDTILCKGREVFLQTKSKKVINVTVYVYELSVNNETFYLSIIDKINFTGVPKEAVDSIARIMIKTSEMKERMLCKQKQT